MNNKQQLEQQVEAALNSLDGVSSAIPKPFLLTRINARLHAKQESIWDKTLYFISRPAIAFAAVCIVIALNVFVVVNNNTADNAIAEEVQNTNATDDDDMAANILILDNENIEP
jgi:hypothetical protein